MKKEDRLITEQEA